MMKTGKTRMLNQATHIVRAIDGTRKSRMFNDTTAFGRSYKIWGWSTKDYETARSMLAVLDIDSTIIVTRKARKNSWSSGGNTRLWVFEN